MNGRVSAFILNRNFISMSFFSQETYQGLIFWKGSLDARRFIKNGDGCRALIEAMFIFNFTYASDPGGVAKRGNLMDHVLVIFFRYRGTGIHSDLSIFVGDQDVSRLARQLKLKISTDT